MTDEQTSDFDRGIPIVLFQYTRSLQCKKTVLYVNENRDQIVCKQLRVLLPSSTNHYDIMDILGLILGAKSKTFNLIQQRKPHLLRRIPFWCCFSIICRSITLDFRLSSDVDEDRIISIFLGIQRLLNLLRLDALEPPLKWPWTYSTILAKRGWMKVRHLANERKQTRLQLLTHNARIRGQRELAEARRRRRSLWSGQGNPWNPSSTLQLPAHQCIVYRQTLNDFLEKIHKSLREPVCDSEQLRNQLQNECARFASILQNESNVDLEACRLFNQKIESILTESDLMSTDILSDTLSMNVTLNRMRPSKLTLDVREDTIETLLSGMSSHHSSHQLEEEEKYDAIPMLRTACSLEQKTVTATISTMQSEHGMIDEEESGGASIIEEKMNVNTNRNPSVQSLQSNQSDVDDISAEFEYFEALMSAFVESVSSTGSERRK